MVRIQLDHDDLPSDVSEAWIDSLYHQFDVDRNGFIDDAEWEDIKAALPSWQSLEVAADGSLRQGTGGSGALEGVELLWARRLGHHQLLVLTDAVAEEPI